MGRGDVLRARRTAPEVAGHPIEPAVARTLKSMLEGVVIAGTGRSAGVAGYRVAGKTGTAQIPVAGGYSRNSYIPSFVGFAPADRPRLVGVVAVAEPQGFLYHGGQVAAPVFGAVARQVLLYLGVRPERQPLDAWPGQIGQPGQPILAGLATPAPLTPVLAAEIHEAPEDVFLDGVGGPSPPRPPSPSRTPALRERGEGESILPSPGGQGVRMGEGSGVRDTAAAPTGPATTGGPPHAPL